MTSIPLWNNGTNLSAQGVTMNQASPKPAKQLDLSNVVISPLWAILISLLLLVYTLYFHLPVLSFRFMAWIPAIAVILLPLWGIHKLWKILRGMYILLLACVVLIPLASSGIFNAGRYRKLIGEVEKTEFSSLVAPVNLDQVPIIDQAFAASLAEKKLGEDFALGSRVVLGTPTIQMVNSRLYWVVPLLHSGFFKWLSNMQNGTPGYIMVSATNPQDITFIREVGGTQLNMRYQKNSFFGQDLYRHLYMHGYTGIGMAGDTFEIDNDGEPHWTITVYNHKIGVRGPEAMGLATVHACTGKIKYYPLIKTDNGFDDKNIPQWVDRVQPAYFVIPQLGWWGKYVNGFWNTLFGKRDMLMTTEGHNVIYGRDRRSYFYTGLSSVGSDESTVGFVLTDTRTKKTSLYLISGATEYAAMRSAQGKVQNFKYYATFPILVNINGQATYFMTLKDSAGLVKMFCFVSVKDFSLVGVGETIKSARDDYLMALASSRVGALTDDASINQIKEGILNRIGDDIKDGRTFYYFSLNETPGFIYIATSNLSSFLPLSKPGDSVRLGYRETTENEINLSEFSNLSLEGK